MSYKVALGLGIFRQSLPGPPNYPGPLMYAKYPLLRTTRALLKGPWGVLVGFGGLEKATILPTFGLPVSGKLRIEPHTANPSLAWLR